MRPCHAWRLLAVLLVTLPLGAIAQPFGYGSGFSELYRITLADGSLQRIGPVAGIGFNDVEGLAFSADGTLYGVVDQTMQVGGGNSATTDFLIRIGTGTGAGTLVGQLPGLQGLGPGAGQLDYGLAFTCDGRLWMSAETTGELWEVNPATAALRAVGATGASISGLAARGNRLYGVSVDPNPGLYEINLSTGSASSIGPLGIGGAVAGVGLDFDSAGVLWATLDPGAVVPGFSRLVRVDPLTGAGTLVATMPIEFVTMKALAIAPPGACGLSEPAPVPGPGLPLLALLGALGLAAGLRRLTPG